MEWPILNRKQKPISPCPYILGKKVLGTGSYSHVYECKNIYTGKHYAAKQYTKRYIYGLEQMLQAEFAILKKTSHAHANILSMEDYFETPDCVYLVTDLALGGELFDRIINGPNGHLSVWETSELLAHLLSALSHLHRHNIVHRDVKAENILFKSKSSAPALMLLADFGTAVVLRHCNDKHDSDFSGTLSYMAPEMVLRQPFATPVDMWSVGVLAYFMLCGYMPFDCDSEKETRQLIAAGDYVFEPHEYWDHVPLLATDFISRCFTLDPTTRLTAVDALAHPFITGNGRVLGETPPLLELHRAVWKLHASRARGSSPDLLRSAAQAALKSPLSRLSLREDSGKHPQLLGDCCYSPGQVSTFSTPVPSSTTSPSCSLSLLHRPRPLLHLPLPSERSPDRATFVL